MGEPSLITALSMLILAWHTPLLVRQHRWLEIDCTPLRGVFHLPCETGVSSASLSLSNSEHILPELIHVPHSTLYEITETDQYKLLLESIADVGVSS